MDMSDELKRLGLLFPLAENLGRKFVLMTGDGSQVFAGVIENIGIVVVSDNGVVHIEPVGGRWNIHSSFLYVRQHPDYPWFLKYADKPVSSTAQLHLLNN